MRCLLLFLFAYILIAKNASGQEFKLFPSSGGAKMLDAKGDTLHNPWAGGLLNPQFSNIDVNNDGLKDIFIFEPTDYKVSVYQSLTTGGFIYLPDYEAFFPHMQYWALLADYNNDGKEDIFTYSTLGAGLDVYKNVSTGKELKFKKVAEQLSYHEPTFTLNLYVPSTDIPAIADVDNDGDMDILSYDVLQTHIQYYKNMSMEKYGNADSLDFAIADRCWGKFAESFSSNTVILGEHCGKVNKQGKKHGGSTLLAFDGDGDGDKDMVLGDIGYKNLIYLENGRIKNNNSFTVSDSMISVDTVFPRNTVSSDITLFPAAFAVDVNADGKKDLIVSPQALFESQSTHQVLTYINRGTAAAPKFDFYRDDFIQNTIFSGGDRSAPAFVDYNADGLMDMVVSVKGNTQIPNLYNKLVLYKNTGTLEKAVFSPADEDFANISKENMRAITPTFADINGDAKPDMILGNEEGEVLFYYNSGTNANGVPKMTAASISKLDVGTYSKPAAADIDGDGLTDIVIGELNGNFNYYKNTGSSNAPAFTFISDTFGRVVTNHFYYQYVYNDSGYITDSTLQMNPRGASAPEIADMDGDGKPDMISGSNFGEVIIYFNIQDSLNGTFSPVMQFQYNAITEKKENRTLGYVSVPAAADLDGDGKPDLMIGNNRGGLYYLASQQVILGMEKNQQNIISPLKIFPNPAQKTAYIQLPENTSGNLIIRIHNTLGQQLYMQHEKNASNKEVKININHWKAGVYIVSLQDHKGNHFSGKLYIAP